MNGNTRLVLCAEEYTSKQLIGVVPLEKFDRQLLREGSSSIKVYNAWEQILGETIMYNTVLQNLEQLRSNKDMKYFVEATTRWLLQTRRVAEIDSGLVVRRAWFVKVDKHCRIVEVIY